MKKRVVGAVGGLIAAGLTGAMLLGPTAEAAYCGDGPCPVFVSGKTATKLIPDMAIARIDGMPQLNLSFIVRIVKVNGGAPIAGKWISMDVGGRFACWAQSRADG